METLDARYRQANKEALWSVALAVGYFVWWYASAYGLAPAAGDPLTLYWGVPLWFLMACIIGPIVFILLSIAMVKFIFKDMSLEITPLDNDNRTITKATEMKMEKRDE
ncbi:YhdT family protein [Vibrio sp. SS-MA-C1-2]|uniref:YhdT family protein n=1 Tax=Vibrio sp. SS-MA-C1-2 TaxID=2908646 RepID=UPI001F4626AB|nr:YhdT family protein [Vibrio sp. SS-MA-C1-2]UJF19160.1 YhdT family protein [Vibrio sp. SS-MA-C1-2]